jgi:hypothetical protein
MISVRAICAAVSRSVEPACRDGRDDDRRRIEVERADGRVDAVRQRRRPEVGLDRGDGLVEVGAVVELGEDEANELADVERSWVSPGTPDTARSIGFATCSVTSEAPAPGIRRDDGHDRERDVRQQLLLEAAPGEDARDEQGGGEEERDAPLRDGELGQAGHELLLVVGSAIEMASVRIPDGALDDLEVSVTDQVEEGPELADIELPHRLECLAPVRRDGHLHLPADWPDRRSG